MVLVPEVMSRVCVDPVNSLTSLSNQLAPKIMALLAFLPRHDLVSVMLNVWTASRVPTTRPSLSITSPGLKTPDTCSNEQ